MVMVFLMSYIPFYPLNSNPVNAIEYEFLFVTSKSLFMTKEKLSTQKEAYKSEKVNWLMEWPAILFKCDPDDREKIKEIKRGIRIYARGWLAEENAENGTNYIVEDFDIDRKSKSPLEYTVKAFLNPPARESGSGPGGHIIPPPPPPPPNT